jgi:hypothetical protein
VVAVRVAERKAKRQRETLGRLWGLFFHLVSP